MKSTSRILAVLALSLVGSLAAASPAAASVNDFFQTLPVFSELDLLSLLK
ncbi:MULTISPECIES: hypothetical protein [unclassified Nocardiopsis]|nr:MULTISPECIES: hypothetical protein [unclassified Nocardiopsis]